MIVPHHYTLWQAASSPSTQAFLMIGTLFLLPVILFYTGWSYWVFQERYVLMSGIIEPMLRPWGPECSRGVRALRR